MHPNWGFKVLPGGVVYLVHCILCILYYSIRHSSTHAYKYIKVQLHISTLYNVNCTTQMYGIVFLLPKFKFFSLEKYFKMLGDEVSGLCHLGPFLIFSKIVFHVEMQKKWCTLLWIFSMRNLTRFKNSFQFFLNIKHNCFDLSFIFKEMRKAAWTP